MVDILNGMKMRHKDIFGFWKNKKVLVTGHTGFKGSWLSILLKIVGAEIAGYALNPSDDRNNFNLCRLEDKIIDVRADITDYEKLKEMINSFKPDIVFHLAAQPLVRYSYENVRETYQTNIMGTLNVLECIKACKQAISCVIVTSDKCYHNKEQLWGYREDDALGGFDPYSSSKACVEILVSSYRHSFFNPTDYLKHHKSVATARAGNVIGGGDWSRDRIIPDCMRALEAEEPIIIRNPKSIRPWQHTIEPLFGYLLLAQQMYLKPQEFSGAWNFGPEFSSNISVWELAMILLNKWKSGSLIDGSSAEAVHEASLLSLDITKAKMKLGWQPRLSVEKAVEMTVSWYKYALESGMKQNMYDFCSEQIKSYLEIGA